MLSPAVPELVSIVTPFHDDLRFFDDTVASVFGQTYPEWEWLLVDDGSEPGCAERARTFAASHPERVRYLRQPDGTRHGGASARNIGIAESRGEYLALLDIDDVWFPGKLSVQTEILNRHPEVAMVYNPLYFWYSWPGNEGQPHPDFVCPMGDEHDTVVEPPAAVLRQIRIADGLPGTCSALLRTDAVRAVGGFEGAFGLPVRRRGVLLEDLSSLPHVPDEAALRPIPTARDQFFRRRRSHGRVRTRSGDTEPGAAALPRVAASIRSRGRARRCGRARPRRARDELRTPRRAARMTQSTAGHAGVERMGFFDYSTADPHICSYRCEAHEHESSGPTTACTRQRARPHERARAQKTVERVSEWLRPGGRLLLAVDLLPKSELPLEPLRGRRGRAPDRAWHRRRPPRIVSSVTACPSPRARSGALSTRPERTCCSSKL